MSNLKYDYPCGFARTQFIMLNPRKQLEQHHKDEVERLLGMHIKVIYSRI